MSIDIYGFCSKILPPPNDCDNLFFFKNKFSFNLNRIKEITNYVWDLKEENKYLAPN